MPIRNCNTRLLLALVAILPLFGGCSGCRSTAVPVKQAKLSADETLQRMIAAYQEAQTYEDRAQVRVSYKLAGKTEQKEAKFEVKFARPNRLSLNVYQLELVCDGQQLHALITDQATLDLDGQVVKRDAPAELSLTDLLNDEELRLALCAGPCRQPVQLELLLGDKPLELFLSDQATRKLLDDEKFDNRDCRRVEVRTEEEAFVLWIDREDFTLRRLEYPTAALAQEIKENEQAEPSEVRLSADFFSARLGGAVGEQAFVFHLPKGAKLVSKFMRPPQMLPSALFGKRPEKFHFTTLAGDKISQADLEGKIAVLMWFVADDVSREALGRLDKVRGEFESEKGVLFYAVCAEPQEEVSDEKLTVQTDKWGLKTSVLRDVEEFGNSSFQIPVAPTLIILDASGNVQIFESGVNPVLDKQLPVILKRLLKGIDLASELVRQAESQMAAYQKHLSAGGSTAEGSTIIELPPTKIDAWQEPELFKLTKLWTRGEIESPGNLLVVEGPERHGERSLQDATAEPRILAMSGWRNVVELDARGEVVARHELPRAVTASFLRTAVDGKGKRFYLAGTVHEKQVFLFDEEWKLLLSFPEKGQTPDHVQDAQLCDLDGDGKLEICLGFWGSAGVQAVDLSGQRLWGNRKIPTVLSLAEAPPNEVGFRKLLVTGDRGTVLRVNQFGNADTELRVGDWAIHHLFTSRFAGRRQTQYVGLSLFSERNVQAVALDDKLQEQWSYPLPEGVFRNQIQYVTSGHLLDADGWIADVPDGQWVFAGANGSVHLVNDEGTYNDMFCTGESLSGLAVTRLADAGVLLISSDKGVTAWKVEPK